MATVGENDSVVYKKAKDLSLEDLLWSPVFDEYTDESDQDIKDWSSETFTITGKTKSKIKTIKPYKKFTLYLNKDKSKTFSGEQPILVKSGDLWKYISAQDISVGDYVLTYDCETEDFEETLITSITHNKKERRNVYAINIEEIDLFVAGGIIVHNK